MPDLTPQASVSIAWTKAQPAVASYICSVVPNHHEAEDILQKVAVVIVEKFDQFESGKSFLAWTIGIAKFEILHYRRAKARERVTFNPDLIEQLPDSFVQQEERIVQIRRAIKGCVERLPARSREVFSMRYGQGLSISEVAHRLDLRPNTASVALHKARLALRKCLASRMGDSLWH